MKAKKGLRIMIACFFLGRFGAEQGCQNDGWCCRRMRLMRRINRGLTLFLLCGILVALSGAAVCAGQESGKGQYHTTQLELQSQLMSFADQLAAILGQARYEVSVDQPDVNVRTLVRTDLTLSLASAFTIAASANPEIGLLDMVVMVTLGRMIYEERWRAEVGENIQPMLAAFKQLEADIWSIAANVLTQSDLEELRDLIIKWRRENPNQFIFSHIRFSDFAAERHGAPRDKGEKPAGLLKAVKQATQSVDKMLLLAERGLYLGARIPLLVSTLAHMGMMEILGTKEIQEMQTDAKRLAESMSRLADSSEKLPGDLLKDLMSEEERLRGLLEDLNKTFTAGTKLMASASTTLNATTDLVTRLGFDQSSTNGKTIDPVVWINFVDHLNTLTASLTQLLESPGWQQRMPQMMQMIDGSEQIGKNLVDRAFIRTIVLILILLFGSVVSGLLYRYVSRKLFGPIMPT